jgi:hypothetical protein
MTCLIANVARLFFLARLLLVPCFGVLDELRILDRRIRNRIIDSSDR